jgi:hypothetical protein
LGTLLAPDRFGFLHPRVQDFQELRENGNPGQVLDAEMGVFWDSIVSRHV